MTRYFGVSRELILIPGATLGTPNQSRFANTILFAKQADMFGDMELGHRCVTHPPTRNYPISSDKREFGLCPPSEPKVVRFVLAEQIGGMNEFVRLAVKILSIFTIRETSR